MNTGGRAKWVAGFGLVLFALRVCGAQPQTLAEANRLESQGRFKQAEVCLDRALESVALPADQRKVFEFERDRLERIKLDFPLTKEALYKDLRKALKQLTPAEFEAWVSEGRFDCREIDGHRRFMASSVSNLFWRYPELSARRVSLGDTASLEHRVLETCVSITTAATAEHKPYVLPKQFEVTMTVTAKADAAPSDQVVRAWLPIPRDYPFQGDYKLLAASAPITHTASPQSPIRSVVLEAPVVKHQPTQFQIRYSYATRGVWFDVKPDVVRTLAADDPELRKYLGEAPHIAFTAEMRALSSQIAAGETNPYLQARKFYDWIAENIKYSFAVEYSTIRDLGDYCRSRGYGDCGQEALLFMTLCRMNGIPARWQSGWNTFPGAKSIHDWTEIYVAPYGWMPVDPYMGIFAMRYATSLRPEQRLRIRDFYFGGLDQYRMIANSDHSQELDPPKQSMRSDTVDFQRGELEWGSHNLYLDKFSYDLTVKEITVASKPME